MKFADFADFGVPFLAFRSLVANSFATLLAMIACAPPLLAQQDPTAEQPKKADSQSAPRQMEIIPLKYAPAHEVAVVIGQSFRGVNVAVDERSNSVIISYAERSALDQVGMLISQIDRPVQPRESSDAVVEFFRLPHGLETHVNTILGSAKGLVGRDSSVSIAANTLVFRGSKEDYEHVRSLFSALEHDSSGSGQSGQPVTLSFYVLAAGDAPGKQATPEALKSVTAALAESGFPSMSLLAPLQINSAPSGREFELSASPDTETDVRVRGVLSASSVDEVEMRFEGEVVAATGGDRHKALQVSSTIHMRLGEYVVLAAAPTGGTPHRSLAIVVRAMPAAK